MYRIENKLKSVSGAALRPTQMTIGLKEVARKQKEWARLVRKRRSGMSEVLFPAAIGPRKIYYILDDHYTAVALVKEHARQVQVGVVKDLSKWEETDFWNYLDHLS